MRQNPKPFEIYKHFKGNLYQILAIAEHSETGEQLVIYQALYGEFKIYARELSMFMSPVDRIKYPNATQANRFELQVGIPSNREITLKMEIPSKAEVRSDVKEASDSENLSKDDQNQKTDDQNQKTDDQNQKNDDQNQKNDDQNQKSAVQEQETGGLDPMLIQFLDADSYEEKLNILTGVRHRITKEMLTTMAVASDIEIKEGSIEEQYDSLKQCLMTLQKYECNRLR